MEEEFLQLKTEEEVNQKFLELMKGSVPYSDKELLAAAHSFFRKLKVADEYKPSKKFNGDVVLMRATDNFIQMDRAYGLAEVLYFFLNSLSTFIPT